jgi:VanZ family protein
MKITLYVYVFILAVIIFLADWNGTAYLLDLVMYVPFGDKIGHFLLAGIFSFLLNMVLGARKVSLGRIEYLTGSLIVLTIVTIEEISQIFVGGRTFDWSDLFFDYLGVYLFGEIARVICRRNAPQT